MESDDEAEYGYQTHLAGARAIPMVFELMDKSQQLPFPKDSFHAVMACYAAGGGLKEFPWVWREWARVLKPGGLVFLEKAPSRLLNMTSLCFRAAPPSAPVSNRYKVKNTWRVFRKPMLVYTLMTSDACLSMFNRDLDDGEALTQPDGALGRSTTGWPALIEWLSQWIQLPSRELAMLAKQDEASWRFNPPGGSEPSLSIFPSVRPSTSRAIHVLNAQAKTPGLLEALRARSMRLWGIAPGGVRASSVAPIHQKQASRHHVAIIRHDWCSHAFPSHPRAFDIIVVEDAPALVSTCLKRVASELVGDSPAVLRHLILEGLRLVRPGPLGLILLMGGNDFALADPESSVRMKLLHVLERDVNLLGCTEANGAGQGIRACALQRRAAS